MKKTVDTSWETSANWYDKTVGEKGHYYHSQVILPGVLRLSCFSSQIKHSILDLACGQGILARHIPPHMPYIGIDSSPSLIATAVQYAKGKHQQFLVHDLCQPLDLPTKEFTHATCILAAQNIEELLPLFLNAYTHLAVNGTFILVINHPCFRIPRQSQWGIDEQKKLQFRRLDLYMSSLNIPIQTTPSQHDRSPHTISFHRPLSMYSSYLKQAGFVIDSLEEWCSDKVSTGKMASLENRSRKEFPLFLALVAKKINYNPM